MFTSLPDHDSKKLQNARKTRDLIIRYLSKETEKVVAPIQEVQSLNGDQEDFSIPNQLIRHAQEVTETDIVNVICSNDVEQDQLGKAKLLNIVRYLSQAEMQTVSQEKTSQNVVAIPIDIIEKAFIESKSVENFAKKLTFAIFSPEERCGKNCTGRVPRKGQHKDQLDPVKLQAVKKVTFQKYSCKLNNIDYIWRRCIKAIDSALRNEKRKQVPLCQQFDVRKPG